MTHVIEVTTEGLSAEIAVDGKVIRTHWFTADKREAAVKACNHAAQLIATAAHEMFGELPIVKEANEGGE